MAHKLLPALALACALLWPAVAEARACRCSRAVPVVIEGAGTFWICARTPCRRG